MMTVAPCSRSGSLAKVAGITAVAFAVLVVFDASLAAGLYDSGEPMDMDNDMPMP